MSNSDNSDNPASSFNPSRTFILRPVATSLLMVALLLVGVLA
jgi:multidrug efflux pump